MKEFFKISKNKLILTIILFIVGLISFTYLLGSNAGWWNSPLAFGLHTWQFFLMIIPLTLSFALFFYVMDVIFLSTGVNMLALFLVLGFIGHIFYSYFLACLITWVHGRFRT